MENDTPIYLDAPPWNPIDVPVYPDLPPWLPFDVPIYLDGPPWQPVDVTVYFDSPPWNPIDVQIYPDAPPWEPVDVPTYLDGPPWEPIDVPTYPDLQPWNPIDVPVYLDLPPWEPVDVPVYLDSPPVNPIDVPTYPDGPPFEPVDVPVYMDLPPADTIDVPVYLDSPPRNPIDVPIYPDFPPRDVTVDSIINHVMNYDKTLTEFINSIAEIDVPFIKYQGAGALDPTVLHKWLKDYSNAVGADGIARFITEQTILYSMNPTVAKIFDPTYFLKMMIPGSMGNVTTALDVESGITMQQIVLAKDELIVAKAQNSISKNGYVHDLYNPENKYTDGQAAPIDVLIDDALENKPNKFLQKVNGTTRFNTNEFFESRSFDGSMNVKLSAKLIAESGENNIFNSKLARSAGSDGIINSAVIGEDEDGSVISDTQNPSEKIDDDDARVPVSFTDLRQIPGKKYRSVYFKPINLQITQAINPEYNETESFGRVDSNVSYKKTSRSFSISFDCVSFSPEDLENIYKKITWLQSMCYPSYGEDFLIKSGPVVRMRIGDITNTNYGGLAGVIKSLNIDYSESLWELKKSFKVPKSFKVSIEFLALHDGPVGVFNGSFGVLKLPSDNLADDSQEGYSYGNFSKFGESRK